MDTLSFFKEILPAQGLKVIAELTPSKHWVHHFFETHEEAAAKALELDAAGRTVYHACATYKTNENRKAENAGWMKSFWVDADVDPENPNKYPDQRTAVQDIGRVCRELQIPLPLIVKSGGGIHGYWTLESELQAAEWQVLAQRFKSALGRLVFKQDNTRTADAASVLRPVGTQWRKKGWRTVGALSAGSPISAEQLGAAIRVHEDAHQVVPTELAFSGFDSDGSDLSGGLEYPPSSADLIIQRCPTLAHVAAQRGVVEEPLWRGMLGLVKFTTEGVQRCHEWSAGHPEYSELETQEKIDRWAHGPTTCAHFRGTNGNQCAGCQHKVTSPIALGYTEEGNAPPPQPVDPAAPEEEQEVPYWPKRFFHWNNHSMCRAVVGDDGVVTWVPFCNTLFYPTKRVREEDGDWYLRIRHQKRNHTWHEFNVPTELLADGQGLARALAAQEIVLTGKTGKASTTELLSTYLLDLQRDNVEQLTYNSLGWADDYQSFVVGTKRITPAGIDSVLAGENVRSAMWAVDPGANGSEEDWVQLVDYLYNRPEAEPYQFIMGCAFAAPLVELTDVDNWHGIPVALTGPTGLGKTTTCRVACSIYGAGDKFVLPSNRSGSTMNALISRIGISKNLPLVLDELTNRDPEEVQDLLYSLSNGRPKDRNKADGSLINRGLSWNTIAFITTNDSMADLLNSMEKKNIAEATQIRVFEIPLDPGFNTRVWHDINAVDLIEHRLKDQHGVVGAKWLQYVIANRDKLRDDVRAMRVKYSTSDADQTRERFYRDLIATVLVALKHATKLGLLKFDLVKIAKWAKGTIVQQRRRRQETTYTPEDYVAQFLSSLYGSTMITQRYGDGRSAVETPMENLRFAPVARMCLQEKLFLVTVKAVNDFCAESKVAPSWFVEQLDKLGYVIHRQVEGVQNSGARRERIGRGTNMPSAPTYVFELDFDRVANRVSQDAAEP